MLYLLYGVPGRQHFVHNFNRYWSLDNLFLVGCGKSLLAYNVAKDLNAKLLVISPAMILSKWLGESQRNLKRMVEFALENPRIVGKVKIDVIDNSNIFLTIRNPLG